MDEASRHRKLNYSNWSFPDVAKENAALQRILHSRQLGLKLIANVTYGYTAANFSGRMPCIEVLPVKINKNNNSSNSY